MEPVGELVPDLGRVGVVEQLLGLARDRAQPVAQVVVDVGREVADPVVQRDLPARRALLELVGAGLRPGQLGHQRLELLRVLLHGQLGPHPGGELLGDGQHVLAGRAAVQLVGGAQHPAQQEVDQRPEAGLVHQLGVLRLRGVQPQRGRDGERVGADPGGVEVAAVQLHDPPPVRVEIGLGDDARDVRAQLHRRAEELQLRARVLLRGVGDQQHGVRAGQRRHRGRPVRRAEPADARGVDEHEPAFEELARQPDLGVGELRLVAGVARLADVLGELVHRHLGALGRPAGRLADERHLRRSSECRTTVGTAVATSSSTGQTGALTSAFTSWLLPCLNSPTTSTRTFGSARRLRVWASRAPRSGRS